MIVKASRSVGVARADKDVFAFLDREKKDGVGDMGGEDEFDDVFFPSHVVVYEVRNFVESGLNRERVIKMFEYLEVVQREPMILPNVYFGA